MSLWARVSAAKVKVNRAPKHSIKGDMWQQVSRLENGAMRVNGNLFQTAGFHDADPPEVGNAAGKRLR